MLVRVQPLEPKPLQSLTSDGILSLIKICGSHEVHPRLKALIIKNGRWFKRGPVSAYLSLWAYRLYYLAKYRNWDDAKLWTDDALNRFSEVRCLDDNFDNIG